MIQNLNDALPPASVAPLARRCCLLLALVACAFTQAHAQEVRVLAAGAAQHALSHLAPAFEQHTGHRLQATYDTVGAQRDRVLAAPAGAVADVVILSDAAIGVLRDASRLAPRAPVSIGQVVVALAVPAMPAMPDAQPGQAASASHAPAGPAVPVLRDEDDLRRVLQSSRRIAYADPARGATAGTHFARVLDRIGLREELAPRLSVLPFGVEVIEAVAQGRFDLGVSQSSEIMPAPGVRFVGGLPAPHALATGYAAAMTRDTAGARALLDFLGSEPAVQAWRRSGFVAR